MSKAYWRMRIDQRLRCEYLGSAIGESSGSPSVTKSVFQSNPSAHPAKSSPAYLVLMGTSNRPGEAGAEWHELFGDLHPAKI
jgi:hypothetical protein